MRTAGFSRLGSRPANQHPGQPLTASPQQPVAESASDQQRRGQGDEEARYENGHYDKHLPFQPPAAKDDTQCQVNRNDPNVCGEGQTERQGQPACA